MARAIDLDKAIEIIEEKQKELCPVGNYGRHYVYDSDREKYDAWEEIIDALNALSTLTPPNEWVSVEERLPEEKQRVIVRCEHVGTSVGWILWGNWMTDIGPGAGKVTHWRSLPAPPDKDNNVPAKTPNEPLTLEQLREMDGEPVYVVPANEYSELGKWCVVSIGDSDDYSCALVPGVEYWSWKFEDYGEQWIAYRRPKEEE